MQRREFLVALSSAVAACPLRARAQQSPGPVIGFLNGGSPYEWAPFVDFFRAGLAEIGYAENRNVAIEFRWAFGDGQQLPSLARDLVDRNVGVIVTTAGNQPTIAAKRATTNIPVLAIFGNDPIKAGIIANLERPEANITGVSLIDPDLESKQLELLAQLFPKASTVGILIDPLPGILDLKKFEEAASRISQHVTIFRASTDAELDKAFASMTQQGITALLVASTAYFLGRRDRLAALAARANVAAMYPARAYVEAGGLISYGVDRQEAYRELGVYAGRLLRGGVTPEELPVRRPTKFELAVNLKTAKALGVTISPSVVTLANVIIQ